MDGVWAAAADAQLAYDNSGGRAEALGYLQDALAAAAQAQAALDAALSP